MPPGIGSGELSTKASRMSPAPPRCSNHPHTVVIKTWIMPLIGCLKGAIGLWFLAFSSRSPKPGNHKGHEERQHLQPQRAQRNAEEIRESKAKAEEGAGMKTPEATDKEGEGE